MRWVGALGRWMFVLAILWLALIPVLYAVSFAYDAMYRPHDMNLPGLLATYSLFYFFFRPLGIGLLILGYILRRLGED